MVGNNVMKMKRRNGTPFTASFCHLVVVVVVVVVVSSPAKLKALHVVYKIICHLRSYEVNAR